jgi:hypothetical protein
MRNNGLIVDVIILLTTSSAMTTGHGGTLDSAYAETEGRGT